jgi:hypothetical protein
VGAERLIARGQARISEYAGPLDDATRDLVETLTAAP